MGDKTIKYQSVPVAWLFPTIALVVFLAIMFNSIVVELNLSRKRCRLNHGCKKPRSNNPDRQAIARQYKPDKIS